MSPAPIALAPWVPAAYARMRRRLDGVLTIGVTGTKGKTSTTEFIAQLMEAQGFLTAVSTTESARIGSRAYEGFWSVPELDRFVSLSTRAGVQCLVIELCSSALRWHLHRAFALDVAVMTNIGTDHIRDHGNRRGYVAAKQRMFSDLATRAGRPAIAVLNADDPFAASFEECLPPGVAVWTYGLGIPSRAGAAGHLGARAIESTRTGSRFEVTGAAPHGLQCRTALHGEFNVSNVLAAATCAVALGGNGRQVVAQVNRLVAPPGRFQIVAHAARAHPAVVVDYAHTPESLGHALAASLALTPTRHVHVVFGCGGDAYKGKRALMGAVAAAHAARIVLTSDNPRSESPAHIAKDIQRGIPRARRHEVVVELDRARAIGRAIAESAPGDLVLVAGKGNERTQEIAGRARPFSDARVARKALDARLPPGDAGAGRLSAIAAVVLDEAAQVPRVTQHAEQARAPASLVKLMTLYVAFEALAHGDVAHDDEVAISRYAATTPHPRLACRAGDRVRLKALLSAVAVRSSNLAATAVSEHIAGDEKAFVSRMNTMGRALGLETTRFATPHGLAHPHHHTTALDMARLCLALLRDHPEAGALLRRRTCTVGKVAYSRPHPNLAERVMAWKTGFTHEAGYNLAVVVRSAGRHRCAVVLGASTRRASFADIATLLGSAGQAQRPGDSLHALHRPRPRPGAGWPVAPWCERGMTKA